MLSNAPARFLRGLNCVLFLISVALLVPYGVVSAKEYSWYYHSSANLFPTLGVIPSFVSAISSSFILTQGGDPALWPNWWLMLSFVADFILSGGFLGIIIASYALLRQNRSEDLIILGVHGTVLLLIQLLIHVYLAGTTLFQLGSRSGPCPHCGHETSCNAAITSFKCFYNPLRRDRGDDPEACRNIRGSPSRIGLPLTPPALEDFQLSKAVKKLRLYTCIIAFAFSPTFIIPRVLVFLATLAPLLTSAFFCLIMTTNPAKKAVAKNPALYWSVVVADLLIGLGNIAMTVILIIAARNAHPGSFGVMFVGFCHLFLAGKATKDAVQAKRRQQSGSPSMSLYEEPPAINYTDNETSGNKSPPMQGASPKPIETPAEIPEERPSMEATEDQRLLDS
ncbi:hypothetical protein NA57DRAFT_80670 [Rhizodiscina lignyota]|uniref:Uncharacterized protein n=1 Tax=Rhizodiscina lignyota TaxID=1504668 RepID=A0A9P4I5J8_9PEZI|nr:hypothetical protein NA57DRAFT_80670 [Rhizodiscina lignyota]